MAPKNSFPSDAAERFQVRMPEGLRSQIAAEALKNNRSMNAEIVARLMASLAMAPRSLAEINHRQGQIADELEAIRKRLDEMRGE